MSKNVTNTYELFTDGACNPNPGGEASIGFALYLNGEEIDKGWGIIGRGKHMTDVIAEYKALSAGLSSFLRLVSKPNAELKVYVDSQFVLSQINNKKQEQIDLCIINLLLKQIRSIISVDIYWIPRELNKRADGLAKKLRSNIKN